MSGKRKAYRVEAGMWENLETEPEESKETGWELLELRDCTSERKVFLFSVLVATRWESWLERNYKLNDRESRKADACSYLAGATSS